MQFNLQAAFAKHKEAMASVIALEPALNNLVIKLRETLQSGGHVYVCGNGGSAADAQHFSSELTGRYIKERPGYSAIALTTDTSALTSIGNDFGFEHIFSRQLEALAKSGDILLLISTSGNSPNLIKAVEYTTQAKILSVGLLGRNGGRLAEMVDIPLVIQANDTPRIQEAHIFILHLICEAFEE